MSRIDTTMAGLKSHGRKALIPYLMAGFPEPAHTLSLMHALVQKFYHTTHIPTHPYHHSRS